MFGAWRKSWDCCLDSVVVVAQVLSVGHITRMKKLVGIILATAITTFAIADAIHGFISSDGIHYFSEQPHRLLFVAVIGIAGGVIAFGFSTLSPGLRRGVKLALLGSGATFVMLGGGYLSLLIWDMPARFDSAIPRHIPWLLALGTIGIAGILWFEFYQTLRRRDCVA